MRLSGLEGRVAVVTGAASGIGRAVVQRLAREGVRLAVVDVYEAGLQQLPRELARAVVRPFVVDLTDPGEVAGLAGRVSGEVGEVSFLVNVAGGSVAPSRQDPLPKLSEGLRPIEEIDDLAWGRILAANLTSTFLVCRAFVPCLKARRSERIVNFASIAARRGSDRVGVHYAAAKGGVIGLTKTLALELGPYGITANAIAPGYINTERIEADMGEFGFAPTGEPPDVVGAVVAWLATSDEAASLTGRTIQAQFFCAERKLLPGWPGPKRARAAGVELDSAAADLIRMEEELAARSAGEP